MDIEKLTKSQIVLLTLLVSFVTSIATGIVTVSLMQQAPPAIAQTVNRVIEHTIETVASSTPKVGQTAAVVENKTIVVNESELIAQAIKQITPSVVRLYSVGADQQFLGLGIVIDASGTIVSDASGFGDLAQASVQTASGATLRAFVTSRDQNSGLLYLTPATSTAATWTPAPLVESTPLLGSLVITLSGESSNRIAQGIVASIDSAGGGKVPVAIDTNIDASSILPGTPLIDTDGAIVGVSTGASRASSLSGFSPASLIVDPNVTKTQK